MKILTWFFLLLFCIAVVPVSAQTNNPNPWWEVQAVDTMKFSRDPSREYLGNPVRAQQVISEQVANVAATGATHVAISTPYDEEFLPLLEKWVTEARMHGLSVWFRGNWSGWEGWFGYGRITPEQHLERTVAFIEENPHLFEDGDIFSGCPECENGGPGDPRFDNGKVRHQQFLIKQHETQSKAFEEIGKDVETGFHSMNGDVARLVMDKPTTKAAGGFIVVDHYVRTPDQLISDVIGYGSQSGGKVVLGEFGAPIPDIHGAMTEQQQAAWLEGALDGLSDVTALYGLNYWTGVGGSTALWNSDGSPREGVAVLTKYYKPESFMGVVTDDLGEPIAGATVMSQQRSTTTEADGSFSLPYLQKEGNLIVQKESYTDTIVPFELVTDGDLFTLVPEEISLFGRLQRWWNQIRSYYIQ